MNTFLTFLALVAAVFLAGWLGACFISLEWSVPLESKGSRTWLVVCVIYVFWEWEKLI